MSPLIRKSWSCSGNLSSGGTVCLCAVAVVHGSAMEPVPVPYVCNIMDHFAEKG